MSSPPPFMPPFSIGFANVITNSIKDLMNPKMVENNEFVKELANVVGKTVVKLLDEKDKAKKKEEKFYSFLHAYFKRFLDYILTTLLF